MRQDWKNNREHLLQLWRGECLPDPHVRPWLSFTGSGKPWAAKMFDKDDEPEPRRVRKSDPREDRPTP
jgi:hypothetical protein